MGTPLFLEGLPILYGTPPKQVLGLEGFRIFTLKQQDLPLPVGFPAPKVARAFFAPIAPPCVCEGAQTAPSRPPRATVLVRKILCELALPGALVFRGGGGGGGSLSLWEDSLTSY